MEIIKIANKNHREAVKKAADFIKRGKVIIFPTDTVYGFLCDATNKKAVDKIFAIKKRSKKKPLPIFVKDIKMANHLSLIDKNQFKVIKKYWPGKTTFILKRKTGEKIYGVDKEKIALRIPKYRFFIPLFKNINFPLSQTSANISGIKPIINIREAIKQFKNRNNKPDLIIDWGNLRNKSSKIIDLTANPYKVLRP